MKMLACLALALAVVWTAVPLVATRSDAPVAPLFIPAQAQMSQSLAGPALPASTCSGSASTGTQAEDS